ncbi:MAG: cell division protein FtsQ/DivIB [Gammaproteobacteria bacterium]|nr:cell division protein FtsQ/DivIB [Gammaproteobacteria bacterium]
MSARVKQAAYIKKKELPSVSFRWMNWFLPLAVVCVVMFYAENHLSKPQTLPVNKIRVHGAFVNVDEAMLHRAIAGVIAGGYFNVDVERVREVVEQLPWVHKASVRRVWPDTLSVSVVEQQPVAISRATGLINSNGEVFKPLNKTVLKKLPVFEGSTTVNKLMLQKYYEMNGVLSEINRTITYLKFDARHAIELKLDNGLKVVLGRDDTVHRLNRFMRIYNKVLLVRINDIDLVDLRYTNGMAIGWKKKIKNTKDMLGDMKNV